MGVAGSTGRSRAPVRSAAHRTVLTGPIEVIRAEPIPAVTVLRVLLLNASHEPLAVVTGRRALVLVVAGKAECVLEHPTAAMMRSPSVSVALPAVVRLRRHVRVP